MKTARIGVLIDQADRQTMEHACNARGEDISSFVRRAIKKELVILGCHTVEDKKILGMRDGE